MKPPRGYVRYQGAFVSKRWLKVNAGKTPADLVLRRRVRAMPERIPLDSHGTFDRFQTILWFAELDDDRLAAAWLHAAENLK